MDDIFTVQQTAKYLKICSRTVCNLIHDKKLGASKVGRAWRITKLQIDQYLLENSNKGGIKNE